MSRRPIPCWQGAATLAFALTAVSVFGLFASSAQAEMMAETDLYTVTRGGQIYDNWISTLGAAKPTTTHPSYPKEGKQKGAATWRCKECHGWDYRGRDGAYAKGSHYTGIKGIRSWAGGDAAKVAAILRGSTHGYTAAMIPDAELKKVARFVVSGQVDMAKVIDGKAKKAKGNVHRGAGLYQTVCAACHGLDGRMINFKKKPEVAYVGTIAENPWETLHKIRNGQPDAPMVALMGLTLQDQVDVLAYCQTLPTK